MIKGRTNFFKLFGTVTLESRPRYMYTRDLLTAGLFILMSNILSCKCDSRNSIEPQNSATREIPLNSGDQDTSSTPEFIPWEINRSKVIKLIGLSDIRNADNLCEIRIWSNYSNDSINLVILKNNKTEWQSTAYYCKPFFDNDGSVSVVEKSIVENSPATGWANVMSGLTDLGLYNLKNLREIASYDVCTDGNRFDIEMWNNSKYGIYEYACIEMNFKLKEVTKIKQICLLIEKEFGYRILDPQFK